VSLSLEDGGEKKAASGPNGHPAHAPVASRAATDRILDRPSLDRKGAPTPAANENSVEAFLACGGSAL